MSEKSKLMTWKMAENMMSMTLEAEGLDTLTFDINEFWKSSKFERLEDVEKLAVWNGLKQKMADKTAVSKELQLSTKEKFDIVSETWKRLCDERRWNKPAENRKGVTTRIDAALAKASKDELAMMVKLGLTTQEKADAELARREAEKPAEAPKPQTVRRTKK